PWQKGRAAHQALSQRAMSYATAPSAQAASAPHRTVSKTTVFARCTKCLSIGWAITVLYESPPPPCDHVMSLCALPPSPMGHSRVAARAWLDRTFMRDLRAAAACRVATGYRAPPSTMRAGKVTLC